MSDATTRRWIVRVMAVDLCALGPMSGVRTMISYRALELGASVVELGVLAAASAGLAFLFAVPIGRWVDRFGEARFLMIGAATLMGVSGALTLAGSLLALILAQAVIGFGQISVQIATQALAANAGSAEGRAGRFGALTAVASAGQMISPAAAGLIYTATGGSVGHVFVAACVSASLGVLVAIWLQLRPPPRGEADPGEPTDPGTGRRTPPPARQALGTIFRIPYIAHIMFASAGVVSSLNLLTIYLPAYGEAHAIPVATIGMLLSVRGAASVASRALMAPMLRRTGRRGLFVLSLLLPATGLGLLPTTTSTPVLIVLLAAAGFGLGLAQPLGMTWVADQVASTLRGTALAMRLMGNRASQMLVPLAVGLIAGAAGVGAIFVTSGVMLGMGALMIARAPFGPPPSGRAPRGSRPDAPPPDPASSPDVAT